MVSGELWRMHEDADLLRIDEAAVRLLGRSGCRVDHEPLLALLEGAGCRVDTTARRCYFPERLLRDAVARLGETRGSDVEIAPAWNPQHKLSLHGSYPHFLDWPSGTRRLATKQDVIDVARMGHTLPEIIKLGRALTCSEVDPRIEPLWQSLILAETTDKPIGNGEIFYPGYIEPLVRMGEVLTGKPNDTSLVAGCDFFIAPLHLDRRQAECFLEKRRFGMTNVPGTMPISGLSSPITIAGTVTVAVAELLAGWALGYVVDPRIPAGGIVSSGSLDMRTAVACFGSPEALLQDMTTVQLCRRLYGIRVGAATGYVDCKRPGLEAVFQKMYPLISAPLGTGSRVGASGLLSAGQDYSPVQQLLDAEIDKALERFQGGFEISGESIAAELIENAVSGNGASFLESEHTMRHFQLEQWYPRWFERSLWRGGTAELEAERRMLERIDDYWKDAVARYEPPDIDRGKIGELRRIYQAAARALA